MKPPKPRPCAECPFKRSSCAGWIGGHDEPSEIIDLVEHVGFPCHMDVTKLTDSDESIDHSEACDMARYCSGGLIMLNNSLTLSRDENIARSQRELSQSKDVFKTKHEFIKHHTRTKK